MAHGGIDQRVAGAVQCGNRQTALLDFSQKCFALCVILDVILCALDKVAAAPAACGHFDCIQTISDNLVQHFSKRNLAENVGTDRKFHDHSSIYQGSAGASLPVLRQTVV